ncbi:MAG: 3-dehydroquinate synthase [Treponema sp.]|nr:3-dehydroquinate synthase [Treponema sp.]MBQ4235248.1 3-dehydroquinate synthase [Treponema sp.]MBQ5384401.1 3-dehydroquinate synthase [Treponema sp.]
MSGMTFKFSYPKDSGFDCSEINFHSGSPDLVSLFAGKNGFRRLFVSDRTIASLPSTKDFVNLFTPEKNDGTGLDIRTHGDDILLILGAGEKFKTLESVTSIVEAALTRNFNRNCEFIGIGGGVICDMTAFAASIFKRGVNVSFVPTTLLAMVDASVGGKSGCDFKGFKNMIGSFWPARTLHMWTDFVLSLPENEYVSGLGEALKTALLFSPGMWKVFAENKDKVTARDPSLLQETISECVKAKAKIVEEDFREHGKRAFLNLGHTFGHALESVAGLGTVTHGEAVIWGIGRALDLSRRLSLCTGEYAEETKKTLASYGYDMKPLPSAIEGKGKEIIKDIVSAMKKDKKNTGSEIRVILQRGLCDTLIQTVSDSDIEAVLA